MFAVLGFIMLWVLLFWIAMQVYLFPLLIALEEKRLGLMFKNAAQLVMVFPLFCLLMLVVALLVTALERGDLCAAGHGLDALCRALVQPGVRVLVG